MLFKGKMVEIGVPLMAASAVLALGVFAGGCGGGGSEPVVSAGTVVFSGSGADAIFTGKRFSPVLSAPETSGNYGFPPDMAIKWDRQANGDGIYVWYTTYTRNGVTDYRLSISSYGNYTSAVTPEWQVVSSGVQVPGIAYDSVAKEMIFTNVVLDGFNDVNAVPKVASQLLVNGKLKHL